MAKAKILNDRIVIESEVLTDDAIRIVGILKPSALVLRDEDTEEELYRVGASKANSFSNYGAAFTEGKSIGTLSEEFVNLSDEDKEDEVTLILANPMTKINLIEAQVLEAVQDAGDLDIDITILD